MDGSNVVGITGGKGDAPGLVAWRTFLGGEELAGTLSAVVPVVALLLLLEAGEGYMTDRRPRSLLPFAPVTIAITIAIGVTTIAFVSTALFHPPSILSRLATPFASAADPSSRLLLC